MSNIFDAWKASHVRRWHANPDFCDTVDPNARHQHGVALLLLLLFPQCRREVLVAAITHDQGEELGDLTWAVKKANPKLAEDHAILETAHRVSLCGPDPVLMPHEHEQLFLCDRLDAWLWRARHNLKRLEDQTRDTELIESVATAQGVRTEVKLVMEAARR